MSAAAESLSSAERNAESAENDNKSEKAEPSESAPLDLHRSPQKPDTQDDLNKSNESRDSKKTPSEISTPTKSRRKRKPNVTKKVSASDLSLSENDLDVNNDIESNILTNVIATQPTKSSQESDCETIDKIAQMVSSITSTSVPDTSVDEAQMLEKSNDEMIEHQLEQMFAESQDIHVGPVASSEKPIDTAAEQESEAPKKKKAQPKPRKKKVEGATAKKKQPPVPAVKLKNGKSGKKGKGSNASDSIKSEPKGKAKENGGKSKVKTDVAPFVQIQKDGTFTIVNQAANGDDDTEKSVNKPKKGPTTDKNKAIRGLHVSTLSNKYDADKRDATWVCVFCKLGPHKHKLGDLFGPYIISKTSEEYSHCLQDPATDVFRQTNKNKFVKLSPSPPEKPKKKRKLNDSSAKNVTSPTVNGGSVEVELFNGMSKVDDNTFEVWFHEDCLVWSNGVYIIGTKIIGLEAAIWSSTRYQCAYCEKNGAMLSCLSRECRKPAHFGCARSGWKLDEDFKTLCESHH